MKKNAYLLALLSLVVIWLWVPDAAAQTKRYVTQAGTGNGTSWADASGDLQAMINASTTGDSVFVAAGTYTGQFFMEGGVQVFGGFAGTETYASERVGAVDGANASILDGDNKWRVLTQPQIFTNETVWDGFVIRNGSATKGAGAYLLQNGILRRCIVKNNQAGKPYTGELVPDQGGVVYRITDNQVFVMAITDADAGTKKKTSAIGLTPVDDCDDAANHFEGKKETATILGTSNSAAAAAATAYQAPAPAAGLADWFLPAIGDWRLFVTRCSPSAGIKTSLCDSVAKAMDVAGGSGFAPASVYWSSTARFIDNSYPDNSAAWCVNFNVGHVNYFNVSNYLSVRSVRAFNSLNYLIHSGGGVYAGAGSRVEGCLVEGNRAPSQAGVCLEGTGAEKAVLTSSTVVNNTQLIATPASALAPKYKVGDVYPKGATGSSVQGVVFWVDETGEHGWIVNLKDQGTNIEWSTNPHDIPASDITTTTDRNIALADTAGWRNTQAIRNKYPGDSYAANEVNFASGWYLPAAGQLNILYSALPEVNETLGGLGSPLADEMTTNTYWSSTACDNLAAWCVLFDYGFVYYGSVFYDLSVRSVRAF